MPKQYPDLDKFFSDPAFQGDRDFFNGIIDKRVEEKLAAELKKREAENNPPSIFDTLFGGGTNEPEKK